MNCEPLADTGLTLFWPLVAALVLIVAGAVVLLLRAHRRRRGSGGAGSAVVLLALVVAALATLGADAPTAQATTLGQCTPTPGGAGAGSTRADSADTALRIVQTSVNSGLAPDAAPTTLAGTVANRGTHRIFVARITVSISAVTAVDGSPLLGCDASDYVLQNTGMPVNRMLEPGDSASFGGASIGFVNKVVNQNACKGATVWLRYLSS